MTGANDALVEVGYIAKGVAIALVGGLFGRRALAVDDRVSERYATFAAALSAIEGQYVDKVESDRVVYSAIRGMLSTLDPHSSFMDSKSFKDMQVQTRGEFGGLGIEVTQEGGYIKVISPIDDTPAARAGVKPGEIKAGDTLARAYLRIMRGTEATDAQVGALDAYLEKGLQAEVKLTDPLSWVQVVPQVARIAQTDRMGSVAAIGLAIGGLES